MISGWGRVERDAYSNVSRSFCGGSKDREGQKSFRHDASNATLADNPSNVGFNARTEFEPPDPAAGQPVGET